MLHNIYLPSLASSVAGSLSDSPSSTVCCQPPLLSSGFLAGGSRSLPLIFFLLSDSGSGRKSSLPAAVAAPLLDAHATFSSFIDFNRFDLQESIDLHFQIFFNELIVSNPCGSSKSPSGGPGLLFLYSKLTISLYYLFEIASGKQDNPKRGARDGRRTSPDRRRSVIQESSHNSTPTRS